VTLEGAAGVRELARVAIAQHGSDQIRFCRAGIPLDLGDGDTDVESQK
jgi:hypothetical protein